MKKDKRVSKLRVVEEQQKEHTVSENISDEEENNSNRKFENSNSDEDEGSFVRANRNPKSLIRLKNLAPKIIAQPILKLSGMGFKFHERILFFDGEILGYFSNKPKNYESNTLPKNLKGVKDIAKLTPDEIDNLPNLTPKQCIKIEYILSVSSLDEDDIK